MFVKNLGSNEIGIFIMLNKASDTNAISAVKTFLLSMKINVVKVTQDTYIY